MPKKKNERDNYIQKLYSTYFNGVQVNMMDIPKIWKDIETVSHLTENAKSADEMSNCLDEVVKQMRFNMTKTKAHRFLKGLSNKQLHLLLLAKTVNATQIRKELKLRK